MCSLYMGSASCTRMKEAGFDRTVRPGLLRAMLCTSPPLAAYACINYLCQIPGTQVHSPGYGSLFNLVPRTDHACFGWLAGITPNSSRANGLADLSGPIT